MRILEVETPEKVVVEFKLAGPGQRMVAYIFDLLLVIAIGVGIRIVAGLLLGLLALVLSLLGAGAMLEGVLYGWAVMGVIFLIADQGYFIYFEYARNGQTPGKQIAGIRVRRTNGTQAGFYEVFLRNILRAADRQPAIMVVGPGLYLLGVLSVLLDRHSRRIGDMVAGTVVVREERPRLPGRVLAPQEKYNSLFEDRPLVGRVRNGISPEEKEALIELCMRRGELDTESRVQVFGDYAEHFREKFRIRSSEFVSDERLVINIAAIVLEEEG
jgi:uncharacterized RDD family membrane protein YckC